MQLLAWICTNCRILGVTTLAAITLLALKSRKLPLHPRARTAVMALTTMGWIQPTLGIATLLLYVPRPAVERALAVVRAETLEGIADDAKVMYYVKVT